MVALRSISSPRLKTQYTRKTTDAVGRDFRKVLSQINGADEVGELLALSRVVDELRHGWVMLHFLHHNEGACLILRQDSVLQNCVVFFDSVYFLACNDYRFTVLVRLE
jgi:hypothetical protein